LPAEQFFAAGEGIDAEALDFERELQRGTQGRVVDHCKHNPFR
jgi:hypothetical protein